MPVYHVELRHFPRTSVRFNQSGTEVGAIVLPWVQDKVIELDGEKWAPYDATITIVEGPSIPVERLSMGRGWATAQREGTDVTERVLAEARGAVADGSAYRETPAGVEQALAEQRPPVDQAPAEDYPSLGAGAGVEVVPATGADLDALLGENPARLLAAWREVAGRASGLTPSEALALAERRVADGDGRGG